MSSNDILIELPQLLNNPSFVNIGATGYVSFKAGFHLKAVFTSLNVAFVPISCSRSSIAKSPH